MIHGGHQLAAIGGIMGVPGPTELLIILGIILLIFGGSKLPGLAKGLGQGIREFKKAVGGKDDDDEKKEIPHDNPDKEKE